MAKKPDPLNDLLAKSFTAPPRVVTPAAVPAAAVPPPPAPAVAAPDGAQTAEKAPPRAEMSAGAGEPRPPRDSRPRSQPKPSKPAPPPAPQVEPLEFDGVKKTTVSFYATEQAQVDQILDLLLKSRRHRGGFSDAIKIALRLCPMDPDEIGRAWDAARSADKRTQRGKP